MAMQIGFSRLVLLVGTGYASAIVLRNRSLSEILNDIREVIKGEEQGDDHSADVAEQVRRLAIDIRDIASARQITVLNGSSGQIGDLSALFVPAATVGAIGYGYMWWKGLSFSDLMYVTKRNMSAAVSNLTKQLDHVSEALAAAKRHLSQRIEKLDDKLDNQLEVSELIRKEVVEVRDDVSHICNDLDALRMMVNGLDGKILSLEEKQDIANMGVWYLCNKADGKSTSEMKEQLRQLGGKFSVPPAGMGMKEIAYSLVGESNLITDGNAEDFASKMNNSAAVTRMNLSKPVC